MRVLVMHGDDNRIVPYAHSGPLSAKLLKNGKLKTYKGFPHGCRRRRRKPSTRTSSKLHPGEQGLEERRLSLIHASAKLPSHVASSRHAAGTTERPQCGHDFGPLGAVSAAARRRRALTGLLTGSPALDDVLGAYSWSVPAPTDGPSWCRRPRHERTAERGEMAQTRHCFSILVPLLPKLPGKAGVGVEMLGRIVST